MRLIAGIRSLLSRMAARRRLDRERDASITADTDYWLRGGAR